jgi:hypothetical protein
LIQRFGLIGLCGWALKCGGLIQTAVGFAGDFGGF